ncbi:MAG: hypothetical protein J1F35_06685 [Erysipelotrichales bacterium]|nr:hypothetical protein [Erysipelotrichales bacterium]
MRYRSKTKEIEAIQWTGDNFKEIQKFYGKDNIKKSKKSQGALYLSDDDDDEYSIIKIGDYIVKANDGLLLRYEQRLFENSYISEDEWENIDDGYHSFKELYEYRKLYNAAFFNLLPKDIVLKSKRHSDGEECFGGGWFIVQAELPTGQISNHYEMKDWDLFKIPEKEFANEWDGHSPEDVANRIREYILNY